MLKRIRIDVTDNCNLRCSMCTIHDGKPSRRPLSLDVDRFLANVTGQLAGLVSIQLGNIAEPLLHPRLGELVRKLRAESGCAILVQTNGLHLAEHLEALVEARCDINVSLDSLDPAVYARLRGGARLDRVLRVLDRIDGRKVRVHLTPVWQRSNVDEAARLAEYCRTRSFRIGGNPLCLRQAGGVIRQTAIEESLWFDKAALRRFEAALASDSDVHNMSRVIEDQTLASGCQAHHDELIVLADGNCLLCWKETVGNLLEQRLEAIDGGPTARRFREEIDFGKAEVCRSCDFRSGCLNPFAREFRSHVSKEIHASVSATALQALSWESPLSDAEQKELFCEEIGRSYRILLAERGGYSLFRRRQYYTAVPHGLGAPGLDVLSAQSLAGLIAQVDAAARAPFAVDSRPRLLGTHRGMHLFACDGIFLATDSAQLDLDRFRAGVDRLADDTLERLKRRIDQGLDSSPVRQGRAVVLPSASPARVRWAAERTPYESVSIATNAAQLTERFDAAVFCVPFLLGNEEWEKIAARLAPRVIAVYPNGAMREYEGDRVARICYGMAYLRSMFRHTGSLVGKRVLEIGCSDGLCCDILANLGAAEVHGVDVMASTGLIFPGPKIRYRQMDGASLAYGDGEFDVCLSIATLEHVRDPWRVLAEMRRVTRPGGICYAQAGPLYFSPFGHHMFGYFDEHPWVHLRLEKAEIAELARLTGSARRIERERGCSVEEYVNGMMSRTHINGLRLDEYGVEALATKMQVDVLSYQPSYEGNERLAAEVASQLPWVRPASLREHGFEVAFRVC